jgi:hypothetical protein
MKANRNKNPAPSARAIQRRRNAPTLARAIAAEERTIQRLIENEGTVEISLSDYQKLLAALSERGAADNALKSLRGFTASIGAGVGRPAWWTDDDAWIEFVSIDEAARAAMKPAPAQSNRMDIGTLARHSGDLDPAAGKSAEEEQIDERYREAAHKEHVSEGTLEIDAGAIVSRSDDGGAYIAAWVWVDCASVGLCKCGAELPEGREECNDCAEQDPPGWEGGFAPNH